MRAQGRSVGLGEYGVKTHPAWSRENGASGYHLVRTVDEQKQLFCAVAHYAFGLGCSRVQNWCLRDSDERVFQVLERSGRSLERAREVDHRFQWFIDDLLYSGDTERLEQLYRSRFRFLRSYSGLWLDHQARGGLTPL